MFEMPYSDFFGTGLNTGFIVYSLLVIWELVWKGIALWKASKNSHKVMFVILLIANTAGILPILYIVWDYLNRKYPNKFTLKPFFKRFPNKKKTDKIF